MTEIFTVSTEDPELIKLLKKLLWDNATKIFKMSSSYKNPGPQTLNEGNHD
jgi:hypothetical protein